MGGDVVTYSLTSTPKTWHPTLDLEVAAKDFTVQLNIAPVGASLANSTSDGVTNTDAVLATSLIEQEVAK